jgi:hypothetical protein
MIWFMLMQVFSTILQIVLFRRQSEQEKDLEILLLRRQLAILVQQRETIDKSKRAVATQISRNFC